MGAQRHMGRLNHTQRLGAIQHIPVRVGRCSAVPPCLLPHLPRPQPRIPSLKLQPGSREMVFARRTTSSTRPVLTSSVRNRALLKNLGEYRSQLIQFEAQLKALKAASEVAQSVSKSLGAFPLSVDSAASGETPVRRRVSITDMSRQQDSIASVFLPIQRWHAEFAHLEKESAALERDVMPKVDRSTLKTAALAARVEKLTSQFGDSEAAAPKLAAMREKLEARRTEQQVQQERFAAAEEALHSQLTHLVASGRELAEWAPYAVVAVGTGGQVVNNASGAAPAEAEPSAAVAPAPLRKMYSITATTVAGGELRAVETTKAERVVVEGKKLATSFVVAMPAGMEQEV